MKNTALQATGEILGKLASLVVFAVLARKAGADGLGTYVLALAWGEVAMAPVGLGVDRYLLKLLAADRSRLEALYYNAMVLKIARGVPAAVAAVAVARLAGYGGDRLVVIAVCTGATLVDTLARTEMSAFTAFERGGLIAVTITAQRVLAAALGIAALLAGLGIVAVATAFAVGCGFRLVASHVMLQRRIRRVKPTLPRAARQDLRKRSLPYVAQDMFGLVIAKADIVLLSLLATDAVVGRYGAAYRLLDATAFVTIALQGAFSAMFTYLGRDTVPSVRAIFQRSIKGALVLLTPAALVAGILAEPVSRAFFGDKLAGAADSLRLLAPVIVLFALYVLAATLIVARRDAWQLLKLMIVVALVNFALNIALIPPLGDSGAALAMLLSSLLYVAIGMRAAMAETGPLELASLLGSPLVAGLAMSVPLLLLSASLPLAVVAGALVYLAVLTAVERLVAPDDYAFAVSLASRAVGRGQSRIVA